MPDLGQSLETDFFSRQGITIERTDRTKHGCSVLLTGPAGHHLEMLIEGPDRDTDQRLLGELLFYWRVPRNPDDVCDDITIWGRSHFSRSTPTAKLGKKVRAFIAATDLPIIPHSTEPLARLEPPVSSVPSFWRRVMGVVRNAAVAACDISRVVAVLCSCMPLSR